MSQKYFLGYVKAIDKKAKTVTSLVSTFQWDRTGEKFAKGSWDLVNFLKNPVVLWSHDNGKPPIGKAVSIQETDEGLVAKTKFDDKSEFAMHIFSLIERGFLNAFSVGFFPKQMEVQSIEGTDKKGLVFTNAELLEFSAVSIPANPGAVVGREVAELAIKALGEASIIKSGEDFLVPADVTPDPVPEPDPEPVPAPPDFTASLKALIDLAKTVKKDPLDESKLALVKTAADIFHEMIQANADPIPREEFDALSEAVKALADAAKNANPSARDLVKKVLNQVDQALKGRPKA